MNDNSESCFGCDARHHGGEACSPGCDCVCRGRPTAGNRPIWEAARAGIAAALDDPPQAARVAGQARLARGQWTDAGAGLQGRLA